MRSIHLLAATTVILAAAWSCGGGSNVGPNTPPTAAFTTSCSGSSCTFTNTSADPDGTFTSSWDFGDGTPAATDLSPTHTYTGLNAAAPFTVVLTVTDNGGLTATANQAITITPEVTLNCVNNTAATATTSDCTMVINQKAVVTVTMASTTCQFVNNTFAITQPILQTLFTNGCYDVPVGTVYTINGTNSDKSFPAGTSVQAQFTQGHQLHPRTDPPFGPPASKVTGGFPDWTIAFDDGGNKGGVGEPNFTDIVLTVHAALAQ